jgi:transmembrane sensor
LAAIRTLVSVNQNYLQFSVEDFIADDAFQKWVRNPDAVADKQWRDWFRENPDQKLIADLAASFITNIQFNTSFQPAEAVQQSLQKNLINIAELEYAARKRKSRRIQQILLTSMAAIAVGATAIVTFRYFDLREPVMVELQTGAGEVKNVLLPDSSMVTINENSSLTYPSSIHKSAKREVWMKGEVFFNVKHIEPETGKAREFVVYSGDLKVEVLGTAFNVKSYRSVTNVSLNTGQIKIGVKDDPVSVTLQPGDFVQYSETQKKLVRRKVDAGLYSTWKEKKVKLNEMPMIKIAQLIQDIYGYKVEIADSALRASKITGSLPANDEKTFLDALAFAVDIDIQRNDSTLLFRPKSNLKKD